MWIKISILLLICANTQAKIRGRTIIGVNSWAKEWTQLTRDIDKSKEVLINLLSEYNFGKELVKDAEKRALEQGQTLVEIISVGQSSMTEIKLKRTLNLDKKNIKVSHRAQIILAKESSIFQALRDLTHELTHFAYRKILHPYSKSFHLVGHIKNVIEGEGGEIEAFLNECRLMNALHRESFFQHHCGKVFKDGMASQDKAKELFYRVGEQRDNFVQIMRYLRLPSRLFPKLSNKHPLLMSSHHDNSYPMAALKEYFGLLKSSCNQDYRRLNEIKVDSSQRSLFLKLKKTYLERCRVDVSSLIEN